MEKSESRPANRFLESLIADLEPVQPPPSWLWVTSTWFLGAGTWVALAILATGPLRLGLAAEFHSLRFALELTLGVAAALALAAAGFEIGVPGAPRHTRLIAPACLLGTAWLGLTLFGQDLHLGSLGSLGGLESLGAIAAQVDTPGPVLSMIGKRAHCFVEGVLISLIPVAPALMILRRRALLQHWASGLLLGAAAASLTAVWMQTACMYEPGHALRLHLSPVLVCGGLGSVVATSLFSGHQTVRRQRNEKPFRRAAEKSSRSAP